MKIKIRVNGDLVEKGRRGGYKYKGRLESEK